MQQAYRALRIVTEAQTIRMVLTTHPGELMLRELRMACTTLHTESSNGVKATVLDFAARQDASGAEGEAHSHAAIDDACAAVRAVAQPVLAVVRGTLSATACALIRAADFTLVASDAQLTLPEGDDRLTGAQAVRLGYVTWTAPAQHVSKEMERILDMLRGKSAAALRLTKASVRLGQASQATQLEALRQVNAFYLTQVMQTADAHEGLHAFLEKRQPEWKNA